MQLERARELTSLLDDNRLSEGPSQAPGYSASSLPVRRVRVRASVYTVRVPLRVFTDTREFFSSAAGTGNSSNRFASHLSVLSYTIPSLCAGATTKE
jgi:hypothetical protein